MLYLPPSRLRALGRLVAAAAAAGVRNVPAVAKALLTSNALAVGAVRRPPCGTKLPKQRPLPTWLAHIPPTHFVV